MIETFATRLAGGFLERRDRANQHCQTRRLSVAPLSTSSIATLLLVGATCGAARAEMTTSAFVELYRKAGPADKQHLEQLASASENGMAWYAVYSKVDLYCQPKAMALTGNQVMDILRRQIVSNEMVAKSPWGLGLLYALKATFPCPTQ